MLQKLGIEIERSEDSARLHCICIAFTHCVDFSGSMAKRADVVSVACVYILTIFHSPLRHRQHVRRRCWCGCFVDIHVEYCCYLWSVVLSISLTLFCTVLEHTSRLRVSSHAVLRPVCVSEIALPTSCSCRSYINEPCVKVKTMRSDRRGTCTLTKKFSTSPDRIFANRKRP